MSDLIKILLAVEDRNLRETLKLIMNDQLGIWDIDMAGTGPEAVEKVKASAGQKAGMSALLAGMSSSTPPPQCVFNLMVMDWAIDGEEEFASLKEIRKLYDKKILPILLITRQRDKSEILAAAEAGANNFLFVPITADLLNSRFREALGRKQDFKVQAALSVFQKQEKGAKREEKKKGKRKPQILTGGASYHSKAAVSEEEARFAVSKVLSPEEKIDGHFHRFVDIVGGGKNCFWAKEKPSENDEKAIELEYVTPTGNSSGTHAETILKTEFMSSFYICTAENCSILGAGTKTSPPGAASASRKTQREGPKHVHEIMEDGKRSSACYFAKKKIEDGKTVIALSYLSSSERPLGHAKSVGENLFKEKFVECVPQNCKILKNKEEQRDLEIRAKQMETSRKPGRETDISTISTQAERKLPYDSANPINGHFQERIKSGATNCMWAKEKDQDGVGIINLEYVSPKGTPSGIHAKILSKEKFLENFVPCFKENCPIISSLEEKSSGEGKSSKNDVPIKKTGDKEIAAEAEKNSEETAGKDGHYQEVIDKNAGVTKCVWMKEIMRDEKKMMETFILSVKGTSTGIHDRYVKLEDFQDRFTFCTKENCDILKRL